MFLFLPEDYKQKVKREYHLRLLASGCFVLGCVALASAVLVFPAYIAAKTIETTASRDYAPAAKALSSITDQDADTTLSQTESYMAALQSLVPLDADAIAAALEETKPSGVSITSVSIGDTDNGVEVSVGGVAGTRNELIAFSQALEQDADFSNVILPVNDLVDDSNVSYTISLSPHIPIQ